MLHDVSPSQFVYMALESVLNNCPSLVQEGNKDNVHEFGRKDVEIKREECNSGENSPDVGGSVNLDDSKEDLEEGEIDEDIDGSNTNCQSKDRKDKKDRKRKRRHHKHTDDEDGKDDKTKKKKLRKHHKHEKYRDHDDVSTAEYLKAGSPAGHFGSPAESPTPYDLLLRGATHSSQENEPKQANESNNRPLSPQALKPRHRRRSGRDRPMHYSLGRVDGRRDRDRRRLDMSPKKAPLCKYFMDGKCQKGDSCPFSHNAIPPRKLEVCKFYILGCCAKKDKCLYMHSDFPCKFFHTGAKCYSEGKCKYSHSPLNDITRSILLRQHLETAPKEILGDFPRMTREGAQAVVTHSDNYPLEDNIPNKEESEDEKENSWDSPAQIKEDSSDDTLPTDHLNLNFYRESSQDKDDKLINVPQNGGGDTANTSDSNKASKIENLQKMDGESDDAALTVPQHLPKRQRELFIRIQQQQLQRQEISSAEESDAKKDSQDNRSNTPSSPNHENNWYSSEDEDDTGENLLSGVLKKLQQNNGSSQSVELQKCRSKEAPASAGFEFDLSKINLPTNIAKVLSSLQPTSDTSLNSASTLGDSKPCKDIDLRKLTPFSSEMTQDSDMRQKDTDLRNFFGDTDLRNLRNIDRCSKVGDSESTENSNQPGHSDVDLRSESIHNLPFKPIPDHIPCKEIDASFGSHPPIKYRLHTVTRSKPDYSQIKINKLESWVQFDPRLQKVIPKRRSSSELTETPSTIVLNDLRENPNLKPPNNVPLSPVSGPCISSVNRKLEEKVDSLPKVSPNDPRLSKLIDSNLHGSCNTEPVDRDPRRSKNRARVGDGDAIGGTMLSDPRTLRSEPLLETPTMNMNPVGGRCALLPTPNVDPRYLDPSGMGMPMPNPHPVLVGPNYYNNEPMGYMGYNQSNNYMPPEEINPKHWGRDNWNTMPRGRGRGRGRGRWRGAPKSNYDRTNYSKDNHVVESGVRWEKHDNLDVEEKWDDDEKWDKSDECDMMNKVNNKIEKSERWDDEDENWDNDQELKDVFANKDPTASPFV